jgi:pentatricopeptide repeat protein
MLAGRNFDEQHRQVLRLMREGKVDEARAIISEMHELAHEDAMERVRQILPDGG